MINLLRVRLLGGKLLLILPVSHYNFGVDAIASSWDVATLVPI